VTIAEARKLIGNNQSKYSDQEVEQMLVKLRNFAQLIFPKIIAKLAISQT